MFTARTRVLSLLIGSCVMGSCSSHQTSSKPAMVGCQSHLTSAESEDPVARQIEHAPGQSLRAVKAADLDLVDYAQSAAETLENNTDIPAVVFTSGRRTVDQQANAMAQNVVANRNWIKQTYKPSPERDSLQTWVDDHSQATTKPQIAAGLKSIMDTWTDAQKLKISKHFAGLAFDVKPADQKTKTAIQSLANCENFFDTEGGLTIWHADFKMK